VGRGDHVCRSGRVYGDGAVGCGFLQWVLRDLAEAAGKAVNRIEPEA
jgi:hypothetical protein